MITTTPAPVEGSKAAQPEPVPVEKVTLLLAQYRTEALGRQR
ncbi:hypothetical protein L1277_002067 [Okibacterium sp. HSC-33S16]|nr:hypothetical protein [Okibacterium sp. HSC-33S16]